MTKCGLLLSAAVIGLSAQYDVAAAQGAPVQIDDVIVTARKREESILRVPVVETVLSQETIEKFALGDLYSIQTQVTGFLISSPLSSIGSQLSIRGIGTTANNPTIDQSVSLNVDGLPLSQGLAYNAGMFDVGQIEILKGPQALFYGKNSPAGVISLRSADPTSETEIIARASYEVVARAKVAELILSGQVAPALKLRFAGQYSDERGYFLNTAVAVPGRGGITPSRHHPSKGWIVRGTALFEPSDNYDARLKLNYSSDRMEGLGYMAQTAYCPDGTGGVAPFNFAFLAGDDCKLNRKLGQAFADPAVFIGVPNNGRWFTDMWQVFGTFEQNLHLNEALTLTSVSGFYKSRYRDLYAASGVRTSMVQTGQGDLRNTQVSQELRLTSDFRDSPFNFMVGGFYENRTLNNHTIRQGNTLFGLPLLVNDIMHVVDVEALSGFGQAIWKISPQWELAGGGRWTHEERDHEQYNFNPGNGPIGPVARLDPHLKSNNFSPEVSLTFTPTDDLTVFATYRQGFKSGSFNTVTYIAPTTAGSFGEEEAKGAELGLKSRLFDRRMNFNIAGYYYNYAGLQVGANERTPSGAYAIRTLNAASAKSYGVDFDASLSPASIQGLTLRTAASWNVARYKDFANAPCGNGQTIGDGCNQLLNPTTGRFSAQDLSGRRLVRAPEWAVTGGFDYDRPIGGDMTLSLGGNANYTSSYSTNLTDMVGFEQPSFIKLGANIALKGPENRWELALIGSNLTNKFTASSCVDTNGQNGTVLGGTISGAQGLGAAGRAESICMAEAGRTVMVRLTYRPR